MDPTTFRMMMGAAASDPIGQEQWTTPGTFSFIVPANVHRLSAVLVAHGSRGEAGTSSRPGGGGSGGNLRWIRDLPVTPGETLTVFISGDANYFSPNTIRRGANVLLSTSTPFGPGPFGGAVGGGNGGPGGDGAITFPYSIRSGGGGGAGGYSGNGGRGEDADGGGATAGSGGAGGGGNSDSAGGSVGIYGEGASGAPGQGGSNSGPGDYFGGGGRGGNGTAPNGRDGAGRAIWGAYRHYPSTGTADQFP